jgi:hypothetical protein
VRHALAVIVTAALVPVEAARAHVHAAGK